MHDNTDNLTVDSWSAATHMTTQTVGLVPKEDGSGYFCPKHTDSYFRSRHEICADCEREFQSQRLQLRERRANVERQLEELHDDESATDILQDLQRSMQNWKPMPEKSASSTPHNALPPRYPQQGGIPADFLPPTPPQPPVFPHGMQTPLSHHPAAVINNNNLHPPPYASPLTSPRINASPPPPTMGYDHLTMQIQSMQRMQDWMLWQKEQECQQLRQRLEDSLSLQNELRVENALLQEKLHQQEQRMQHELKLIKLAAMQRRSVDRNKTLTNSNSNSNNNKIVVSHSPDEWKELPDNAFPVQQTQPQQRRNPFPSDPVRPHQQQQQQQYHMAPLDSHIPQNSVGEPSQTSTRSVESGTTASLDSEELKDGFDSNSITWPGSKASIPHRNSNGAVPHNHHSYKQKVGPLTRNSASDNPNDLSRGPVESTQQNSNNHVGSDDESQPLREPPTIESSVRKQIALLNSPRSNGGTQDNPAAPNTTIKVLGKSTIDTPSLTNGSSFVPKNINVDDSGPPEVPLTENITFGTTAFGTTSYASHGHPPRSPKAADNFHYAPKQQRSTGVSFADDSASMGQSVASSTYGEDRQRVHDQVILDPYGDRGHYTGVILRSTGMPHGAGRMVYQEDRRTYDGEWRYGRWHGFGRATFANGDSYEGEYRFDQRHGRGRYAWHDGRVYDGMFREDKRHGHGIFTWPDGAVFEGEFKNGQREGHGVYRFSDGGRYEGSWKDGRYNGFGICNWEDGRCYKGEWLNGMAHGKGVETFADGTIRHDGQWIEDEPVEMADEDMAENEV
jgi:hypothetical protein